MAGAITFIRNVEYIPMKLHYFFFNAGLAGMLPYLTVYAKQLGISPMGVGIIFTLLPFMSMLAKPLIGCIADRTKKLKLILLILLCIISLSSLLISFIPSQLNNELSSHITCSSHGTNFFYTNLPLPDCVKTIPKSDGYLCKISCCSANAETCDSRKTLKGEIEIESLFNNDSFNVLSLSFNDQSVVVNCSHESHYDCSAVCDPWIQHCFLASSSSDVNKVQFWTFLVLAIFASVPSSVSTSLGDAACFNLLGSNAHLYGYQRLWGTIGWGLFGLITGAINTAVSGTAFLRAYYPGFSLVAAFLLLDILTIRNLNMDKLVLSKSIAKDISKLLQKLDVLMFLCSVFITGLLTSLLWTYLFWHLDTLKASTLLLGGATAAQCFLGELPFMYFSRFILEKVGHFNAFTINFLAFGSRFLLYSYLIDPTWVLLIEILQGPSLGLFYNTMPTYANIAALPGTEATMQGLAGGAFEGLGLAVGSFLGGFVMQNYRGNTVFFYGGIGAFCYAIINILFTIILYFKSKAEPSCTESSQSPDEGTSFM